MAAGTGASLSTPAAQATNMSNSQRTSGGPTGLLLERVQAERDYQATELEAVRLELAQATSAAGAGPDGNCMCNE